MNITIAFLFLLAPISAEEMFTQDQVEPFVRENVQLFDFTYQIITNYDIPSDRVAIVAESKIFDTAHELIIQRVYVTDTSWPNRMDDKNFVANTKAMGIINKRVRVEPVIARYIKYDGVLVRFQNAELLESYNFMQRLSEMNGVINGKKVFDVKKVANIAFYLPGHWDVETDEYIMGFKVFEDEARCFSIGKINKDDLKK
jgi:hypothetical protein